MTEVCPKSDRCIPYQTGDVLGGKYRVAEEVGAGGMGRVVAAEHLLLKRRVAIKLLPERSGSSRRLLREARAAQSLRSENVIFVYDVAVEGDVPYIVMELLEGRNLAQVVTEDGPLSVADAVDLVLQACAGLAEAHAAGIVHRDIKPSNLFLTARATGEPLVKVLDFGISKTSFSDELELTGESRVLGSPYYMSPEQLRNPDKVDARTDVWSLAVTLFALLTGKRPFEGRSLTEVSAAIAADPYVGLSGRLAVVPEGLDEVIARALVKRPEARTSSIVEFAAELFPFASERGQKWAERLREDYATRTEHPNTLGLRAEPRRMAEPMDLTATDDRLSGTRDIAPSDASAAALGRHRRVRVALAFTALWVLAAVAYVATNRNTEATSASVTDANRKARELAFNRSAAVEPTQASRAIDQQLRERENSEHKSETPAPSVAQVVAPELPGRAANRVKSKQPSSSAKGITSTRSESDEMQPPAEATETTQVVPELSAAPKFSAPVDIDGVPIIE